MLALSPLQTLTEQLKTTLSQGEEVLNHMTPSSLGLVISSTLKAQSAEPTQQLVIRGDRNGILALKALSAHKLKSLGKACPSLRQLVSVQRKNKKQQRRQQQQ